MLLLFTTYSDFHRTATQVGNRFQKVELFNQEIKNYIRALHININGTHILNNVPAIRCPSHIINISHSADVRMVPGDLIANYGSDNLCAYEDGDENGEALVEWTKKDNHYHFFATDIPIFSHAHEI